MTVQEAFKVSRVLGQAGPAARSQLARSAYLKIYQKGEHIFRDKEATDALYVLIEGMASLYKINSLGEKKVIFVYGPGEMLNEEMIQELPSSISCEVREAAVALVLPREELLWALEKDGGLERAVLQSMALKIRRLYRQLKNTTNALRGEKRLAAKLFKLARDYGVPAGEGEVVVNMNLSITYLADMLGSKRETVSRQAKGLCALGLIRKEGSQVYIRNMEKLREYFKQP